MPQQPESAKPISVRSINSTHVERKVRTAGQVIWGDTSRALILLADGVNGLIVDIALCGDGEWVRERLAQVIVIGHLEAGSETESVPEIRRGGRFVEVCDGMVLRAILVVSAGELDMEMWNTTVKEIQDV